MGSENNLANINVLLSKDLNRPALKFFFFELPGSNLFLSVVFELLI